MPRLMPVSENASPEIAAVCAEILRTRGTVSAVLKTFGHAPEGLKRFAALGDYVRYHSEFVPRLRELVILAIARGNQYAWSHHVPHARKAGVSEAEISELNDGALANTLTEPERAAIAYARRFAGGQSVSDDVFNALRAHFSERQVVDLTLLAGYFFTLGSAIAAFGVELEPNYPPVMRKID